MRFYFSELIAQASKKVLDFITLWFAPSGKNRAFYSVQVIFPNARQNDIPFQLKPVPRGEKSRFSDNILKSSA